MRSTSIASKLWVMAALVGGGAAMPVTAQELRVGLRLDSRAAMQWSSDTLLVESDVRSFSRLPVGQIQDVWPGPTAGSFAVVSDRGLAMLVGTTAIPGGVLVEAGELLRSSRPDVVWACVSHQGAARRRIVEVRRRRQQRELLVFDSSIRDFDVDVSGRIVALLEDGRVVLAGGTDKRQEIPAEDVRAGVEGKDPRRIFLDGTASQLTLFAPGVVARLEIAKGTWTRGEFDESREALVRHAVSRRMRVEERWVVP